MKKQLIPMVVLLIGLTAVFQAQADVSLMAARVGAEDVFGTGEFYKKAFGLVEVDRLELASGKVELILGFTESHDQSIGNMGPGIAILSRESDEAVESMPHIIFRVTDIGSFYFDALELGGIEVQAPTAISDLGITIAMLKDPAGNTIELLEQHR
ncbi:MAG: putative enzyme related to lactoylglutathione lyase [Pseudohongiellaceae bacterium]|jgi:predicted enzyme related to lactoylglutathione lyase